MWPVFEVAHWHREIASVRNAYKKTAVVRCATIVPTHGYAAPVDLEPNRKVRLGKIDDVLADRGELDGALRPESRRLAA